MHRQTERQTRTQRAASRELQPGATATATAVWPKTFRKHCTAVSSSVRLPCPPVCPLVCLSLCPFVCPPSHMKMLILQAVAQSFVSPILVSSSCVFVFVAVPFALHTLPMDILKTFKQYVTMRHLQIMYIQFSLEIKFSSFFRVFPLQSCLISILLVLFIFYFFFGAAATHYFAVEEVRSGTEVRLLLWRWSA